MSHLWRRIRCQGKDDANLPEHLFSKRNWFLIFFHWPLISVLIISSHRHFLGVPRLIHLFGHKDRPWLISHKPMMSLFARRRDLRSAAGWQPNQKTVITDHETERASQQPKHIFSLKDHWIISIIFSCQRTWKKMSIQISYITSQVAVFITS